VSLHIGYDGWKGAGSPYMYPLPAYRKNWIPEEWEEEKKKKNERKQRKEKRRIRGIK